MTDQHVRFVLPQPVLDAHGKNLPADAWQTHDAPGESVLMQVNGVGAVVRALLPIGLAGGNSLTYGVWLAVRPDDLERIFAVWWEPSYVDLVVTGWLANSVKPWGMLGAPVEAVVRDESETPYCARSTDPTLARVLSEEWPLDVVP